MVDKTATFTPATQPRAYPEMREPSLTATLSATKTARMATGLAAGAGDALRGMAEAVAHPIDTAGRIGSEISKNYAENTKNLGTAGGTAATVAQGAAAFTMRPVAEAARAMLTGKYQIAGREAVGLGLGAAGKLSKFAKMGNASAAEAAAGIAAKAENAAGVAAKIDGAAAQAGAKAAASVGEKVGPLEPRRLNLTGNQGDTYIRTHNAAISAVEQKLGAMTTELDQLLARQAKLGETNTPTTPARLAKVEQEIAETRTSIQAQHKALDERKAALASTVEDVIAARIIRKAAPRAVELTENALVKEAKGTQPVTSKAQTTEYLADIYADLAKQLEAGERAKFPAGTQAIGADAIARHTQNVGAVIERDIRALSPNMPLRKLFPDGKIDQAAFAKRLGERMAETTTVPSPATDLLKLFRSF